MERLVIRPWIVATSIRSSTCEAGRGCVACTGAGIPESSSGGRANVNRVSLEEWHLSKEKLRVYELARELKVESKDLLELCRQAGIAVKNQLSSLDHDQREAIEKLLHRKPSAAPA